MYQITQADIDATTALELAFSTERCLPEPKIIPKEFYKGNAYTRIVDAMFVGESPPPGEITFNPGFEECVLEPKKMVRFLTAHLRSFEPRHEDKIAGIAFMLSKIATVTEAT